MTFCIRQREFITLLGGAAAWPLVARAQRGDPVRRTGALMPFDEKDPAWKTGLAAFTQALANLGSTDGRNVGAARPSGGLALFGKLKGQLLMSPVASFGLRGLTAK